MLIKKIAIGMNSVNTYLIGDESGEIAIIDPGAKDNKIINYINDLKLQPTKIVNTHGHFDHIGGNEFLKNNYNLDIYIHKKEKDFLTDSSKNLSEILGTKVISPPADKILEDGDNIKLGPYKFEVIHTPGHSPGGISLYNQKEKILFSGDTIFKMGIGRADFDTSDKNVLYNSIEKLLEYDNDVEVYPGHGGKTTIGEFKNIWKRLKS